MTANELLQKMHEAGFTIKANGNTLQITQARWIDDDLADLIRQHKAGLLTILESETEYGR